MEMNEGSAASYLARALCIPVFLLILVGLEANLVGLEAKGLLDFQGRRGITSVVWWTFPLAVLSHCATRNHTSERDQNRREQLPQQVQDVNAFWGPRETSTMVTH